MRHLPTVTVDPNADGTLPADQAAAAAYGRPTSAATAAVIGRARAQIVSCADCGSPYQAKHIDPSTGLCEPCYDRAGRQNSHADGDHLIHADPDCPDCGDLSRAAAGVDLALDSLETSIWHLQGIPAAGEITAEQQQRLAALLQAWDQAIDTALPAFDRATPVEAITFRR